MDTPQDILLVGAGAVGQAYGRHLQLGGARVTFLVRPKYADEARAGFTLYPLNTRSGRRREPVRWSDFGVLTTTAEVAATRWDQVWLCVSATALRAGSWFEELAGATGDATIVALTPGLEDKAFIVARCPAERVVSGLINMISYQAPLAGEVVPEPGVAYWFPAKTPLSGERGRVDAAVRALAAGGGKAKRVADASRSANFGSATLMPVLVALEAAGWRFAAVRKAPELALAVRASREANAIVAAYRGERAPWHRALVRPMTLRLLSRLAPRVVPLDVETYLGYHFTKLGDQTRFMLARYVELGAERGLPTTALEELVATLERLDSEAQNRVSTVA